MKNFYVYEHWRPDTNLCFYVGKGIGRRAYVKSKSKRSPRWIRVVDKLHRNGMSHEVRVIKAGLTNDEAIALEIECIKFWKEIGVELTNMTDGGEGSAGRVWSQETLVKIRNPSVETRDKIRLEASLRKRSTLDKTKGGINNGRDAKGRRATAALLASKKVLSVADGLVFPSASAAARHYNMCKSSIIMACNSSSREMAGGMRFKYLEGAS